MKKHAILVISFVLIMSLGACEESQQPNEPTNDVIPEQSGIVEIVGNVMTIDDGYNKATITRHTKGYVASYGDFNILYKDPDSSSKHTVVGFTEWTSDDHLDVRVELLGPRHQRETYTRNGRVLELEIIDNMSDRQYRELENFLNSFDKSGNSVMNNSDGQVLAAILEDNWQDIEYVIYSSLDKRPAWADVVCNLATACVATKCWFGALLNTGCGICASTVASCAIMDAFGWW